MASDDAPQAAHPRPGTRIGADGRGGHPRAGCPRRSAGWRGSVETAAADGGLRRRLGLAARRRRSRSPPSAVRGARPARLPGWSRGRPPATSSRRWPPPPWRRSSRCAAAGRGRVPAGHPGQRGAGARAPSCRCVARWPVVGFVVGAGDPKMADDPFAWRRDRGLVRVCQRLTLVLVGALRAAGRGHAADVPRRRGDRCWASPRSCWAGRPTSARSPSWALILVRGSTPAAPVPAVADAEPDRRPPAAPGPGQTRPRGCRLDGDSISSRSSSTSGAATNSSSSPASSGSSAARRDRPVRRAGWRPARCPRASGMSPTRVPGVRASRPAG